MATAAVGTQTDETPADQETISKLFKKCFNCLCYGWKQVEDPDRLKNCMKCKVAFYCSKECQQEHWVKLHKKHCTWLTMAVPESLNFHNSSECWSCLGVEKKVRIQIQLLLIVHGETQCVIVSNSF